MNIFNAKNPPRALAFGVPFFRSVVAIGDPESVEYILNTNFDNYPKGWLMEMCFRDIFKDSIVASSGEYWYRKRKCAIKSFTTKTLKNNLNSIFDAKSRKFVEHLRAKCADSEIDLFDEFNNMFLEAFAKIGFGV
jgi:cytochrome P450